LLVAPGDVAALAAALERLSSNESLCRELSATGRERVVRELTVDRFVRRLESIYSGRS
jgi:glycosyltransferase involved in cell wall biosynthesis